jgi:hypothetical protein
MAAYWFRQGAENGEELSVQALKWYDRNGY